MDGHARELVAESLTGMKSGSAAEEAGIGSRSPTKVPTGTNEREHVRRSTAIRA